MPSAIHGISGKRENIANKSRNQKKENKQPFEEKGNQFITVVLTQEQTKNSKIKANIQIESATTKQTSNKNKI